MISPSIYSYIKSEESKYETEEIDVADNWQWNMRNHIQMIFHLINDQFYTGENNWLRSFKQVMEPIIGLANWTEDIEVKDVTFFIEGDDDKVFSFLVKKYHDEVYTRENNLDMLFDEITENDNTYGGVIVKKGLKIPEVVKLNSIAFCDQTDILGAPIGFKFFFAPSKLRAMSKYGWGEEKNGATISLDELCLLATNEKTANSLGEKKNESTGKNIEVYVVMGNLPEGYLKDNDDMEYYCNQVQIVAFYTDKKKQKVGVTLYRKEDEEGNLKFFTCKPVYQRALGRGVGEKLLHPQVWTNFLSIHKHNLLEAASKVPLQTDDDSYTTRNQIQDMENLEVTVVADGKQIRQIPTAAPANIQVLSNSINEMYEHAQLLGFAFDPLLGKEASSGTTFRGQERVVAQGKGSHDANRGKRAKFIEEIYRDWIIPDIMKEILKGKKFLAELSLEELKWVADRMSNVLTNKKIKEAILKGEDVTSEQQQLLKEFYRQSITKKGNKQVIEILKGEFEGKEINIGINIAGKQKDLVNLSDKLLSIFQFAFANPAGFQQAMQVPALAASFENILEFGGLSIANFSSLVQSPQQQIMQPQQSQPQEQSQLLPNQSNQPTAQNV